MFIGEYTHSLDDKNRLSLPVKFREKLGKEVVITPGLDGCLFVFSKKEWTHIADSLAEASLLQTDFRSFNRFLFGGAAEVEVDKAGRVLIPDFLRERLKLDDKAVIIGVQKRVEIWNEQSWQVYKQGVEGRADVLADKLSTMRLI